MFPQIIKILNRGQSMRNELHSTNEFIICHAFDTTLFFSICLRSIDYIKTRLTLICKFIINMH